MEEAKLPHVPEVDRAIQNGFIGNQIYSAAAAMASKQGSVFHHATYGKLSFDPPTKKTPLSAIFDLSSLTKPLATGLAILYLVSKGRLGIDAPVSRFLKDFQGPIWDKILLENLLDHTSGLAAHKPFYEQLKKEQEANPSGPVLLASQAGRDKLRELVAKTLPQKEPNVLSIYSDLNFMILGWVVEAVTNKRLDLFLKQELYQPLGLNDLFFVDLTSSTPIKKDFVATEQCPFRNRLIIGAVHDLNAWAMGGIAGHAGLFGSVQAVHRLAQILLDSYLGKPGAFFHTGTVKRFFTRSKRSCNKTWALGFDMPAAQDSLAGTKMSRNAVGHLGFTGCSLWIDLQNECVTTLLTNRVHKTPQGKDEFMRKLRPRVEDLFAAHALSYIPVIEEEEEDPYAAAKKLQEKKNKLKQATGISSLKS